MQFSKDKGIKRVVLSRETTLSELDCIQNNTDIETEIFVHGALCYSLSGMCLFSSYLGGRGQTGGYVLNRAGDLLRKVIANVLFSI